MGNKKSTPKEIDFQNLAITVCAVVTSVAIADIIVKKLLKTKVGNLGKFENQNKN